MTTKPLTEVNTVLHIRGWASPHNVYLTRQRGLLNGEQLLEPLCKISEAQAIIDKLLLEKYRDSKNDQN